MTRKTTPKKPSQLDRKKTGDKFVKDLISETFDQVQKDIEADERALPVLAQGVVDMAENVTDLCEAVRTDMKAVHAKLDLLLKGSDFMKEIGEKEEPKFKKGDLVVCLSGYKGLFKAREQGRIDSEIFEDNSAWVQSLSPTCNDGRWCLPLSLLRPMSDEEVQKYEEQVKAQEQEAKIAKLKFGTRVEYEDDRGWKVAMDKPTPDGLYVIVKEGHARMAWAKDSQLTLIDP